MFTKKLLFSGITLVLFGSLTMSGCTTTKTVATATTDGNVNNVGQVTWTNQANLNPELLINKTVPADKTSLFFIRKYDDDADQTSVNIAVNDRFQVSLHPGSYTQAYSCVGINRLSAEITGLKTNDLLQDAQPFELEGGKAYFFYVDVNEQGQSEIQQITQQSALQVLVNKNYQAHQISRVVPKNCPAPAPKPLPAPFITPPPIVIAPPVLEEKVSIELKVLFDNDKAIIKPQYYREVADVAEFMTKYSNTKAVIEGHTDSNASDSYNQQLSQRRADAVKQLLIEEFGIERNRLAAVGYGESRPIASNETEQGRQQNRRVIAVIEERR